MKSIKNVKLFGLMCAVCGLAFIASCDREDDPGTPVAVPANLTASGITPVSAVLSWTSDAPSFEVMIGGATYTVTSTGYTASGLTPNTAYTWQVRAKKNDVYSEWSASSSFITGETPILSVAETRIADVPASGGSYSVSVTGNTAWTAAVNEDAPANDWCTVANATGDGDGSFIINIAANPGDARSATVTVRATNASDATLERAIGIDQRGINEETGVTIAGITWATRNVNTAGYFTGSPGEIGQYYQYGRNEHGVLASYAPGIANWSQSGTDPCPAGWRLPSEAEILTLTEDQYMTISWRTGADAGNYGVNGLWFGDNAANATAANPQGCIFLPAAGYVDPSTGNVIEQNEYGYYFAGTENLEYGISAYPYLTFAGPEPPFPEAATYWLICPAFSWMGMGDKHYAYPLRCVKQ